MEEHLRRLMAQIETEQGLVFLKEALPHVEELQNIQAKLIRNFFNPIPRNYKGAGYRDKY
jgi:hypothetical protein